MQDTHPQGENRSPRQGWPAQDVDVWTQPSSSRMLTTYLADVEQNLDEQRWDLALRDARDLPHIAVALADPKLQSSIERCKAWCSKWIRPDDAPHVGTPGEDLIGRLISDEAEPDSSSREKVPLAALRRLRLRRHARNAPRGFHSGRAARVNPDAAEALMICTAVVEAVRRWYAHSACHDATAQANLARLAVLR